MDANRFDTLIRSLSELSSRRRLGRGLAAVTVGLVGARLPSAATARRKRKKRNKQKNSTACKNGKERCQEQCVALCPSGQVRNPLTCGCCQVTGASCSPAGPSSVCCSETCSGATTCSGRNAAEACDFSAQCATGFCSPAGLCLFAAP